ncbi:MAG: cell division protein ZipA C-terminal FtsZ-binding domain-containing protein [Betaproteobacteria bacterium]|nr:cell division protein ZipA C-terminal FtsZ-binding domain-containing protein [Betaproteobacteria bacterium]
MQIGLAMLGVLVVAAVVAFNWWQERQFRQRGEEAFPGRHDDVLLNHPVMRAVSATASAPSQQHSLDEPRIEPSMEPRMEPHLDTASEVAMPASAGVPKFTVGGVPQAEIDYIAEIRAAEFIAVEKLVRMQQNLPGLSRRISFVGLNYQTKSWEALTPDDARYTSVCVALQLVDRSGPVNDQQLREFGEAVRNAASEMAAIAELPDFVPALEQAVALDEFCADVDVLVGINVIANTGQVFHGTKIRALAEAAGLQLQSSGVFHCHDEQGGALFSLDNQESEPFLIDRIRNITTPGITFLLDVPRIANGLRVFDRMVAMSRSFADSLDGTLADDNRVLLNDSGLARIRTQLRAIYTAMEQRGIEAGSPLALRLFS